MSIYLKFISSAISSEMSQSTSSEERDTDFEWSEVVFFDSLIDITEHYKLKFFWQSFVGLLFSVFFFGENSFDFLSMIICLFELFKGDYPWAIFFR